MNPVVVHALSRRQLLASGLLLCPAAAALAQSGKPEKPRLVLAVGGKTALYYLPLTVAEQLGFFADEGLTVELQDHAGGSLAEQALQQGRADLATGAFEHPLMLRQRGYGARAFVFLGRAPQMVFGVNHRALGEFRHVRQLRGRRVGVSTRESATHWFARYVLVRAGLAPAEVEFVPVGTSAAAVAAVREGRVEAIASIDPVISMLEFRGDIRVLRDTRSLRGTQELYGGPMPGGCVYAAQEFVLRHPNTVQALTNATVRALKWLQTAGPRDLVRAIPESYMYGDRAAYLAAFDKAREARSPDGTASDEGVLTAHRVLAQQAAEGGAVRPGLALGASFTNDFARRALQRGPAITRPLSRSQA